MKSIIKPSRLAGTITAPTSKSSMQRACAAALLNKGCTIIRNPGLSNDDKAAVEIIQALGADVRISKGEMIVKSNGINPISKEIHCGESGLGIRMFTSIAALSEKEITITGSGSLMSRPMDFFDEILPQLGVKVESNGGKLPLKVRGPLVPGNITVDGNLSSQYTTGLLMAYAAAGAKGVSIHVRNPTSKPYIDLTLEVMRFFGMEVPENRHYEEFVFHGKPEKNTAPGQCQYTVESDWSGGAFLLVAGAIAGPITVCGLRQESTQADKAIMKALKSAGAGIKVHEDKIQIYPSELKGFLFDATDCPDLFPPLVALAAYCRGETIIRGAERLTHKESNRALSLQSEFGKMGVVIDLAGNNMTIHGSCEVQGAEVSSWHDHRIAMACAVAALKAKGGMTITDAEAVGKSYPGFFEDMRTLGADVEV
ncbi:MAG TPA: 3-phosphoshikimate 1-carboxyvinyltransferase [Saprospiraceae bacterium]|nr:3-phosphoshikimate 1-carboxyvinyltransferase [Saprospiraceae bacterium]